MDVECEADRGLLQRRQKRWSMTSQRMEEIVKELLKPIHDLRRSFDTDCIALLEEYLTEAGVRALEEEDFPSVNYGELALILQQSVSIYGKRVDCLFNQTNNLLHSIIGNLRCEEEGSGSAQTRRARGRRRASQAGGAFEALGAEPAAAPARGSSARPPPTLPRLYLELEPRLLTARDAPLADYAAEPIGLLHDFYVNCRLQDGLLIEEWLGTSASSSLRAAPLLELQAEVALIAPPACPSPSSPMCTSPPPCTPPPLLTSTPLSQLPTTPFSDDSTTPFLQDSTSLSHDASTSLASQPPDPPNSTNALPTTECPENTNVVQKQRRKRKIAEVLDSSVRSIGFKLTDAARAYLARSGSEFRLPRSLCHKPPRSVSPPPTGFLGFAESELETRVPRLSASEDDGFCEQSDSDVSTEAAGEAAGEAAREAAREAAGEWAGEWAARVAARAAGGEGVDVTSLARAVLAALPPPPAVAPFARVLAAAAQPEHVARLFLATLFLANKGAVEIVAGPPGTMDTFQLTVVSHHPDMISE